MSDTSKVIRIGKWLAIISMVVFAMLVFTHSNLKSDFGSQEANDLASILVEEMMMGYILFPIVFLIGLWLLLCPVSVIKFRDKLFKNTMEDKDGN